MVDYERLSKLAIEAKSMAYSPYSNFNVGAVLLAKSGKIYIGCNIESASYTPTICAERVALYKAVSEGEREFVAIAVTGSFNNTKNNIKKEPDYCYPCGVCRQSLREFVKEPNELIVIISKTATDYRIHSLGELFPHSFGPDDLQAT